MKVVRLVPRSNTETVEALEWMLAEAKQGRLCEMISLFPGESGVEVAAMTGRYKLDSAKALMAIMRASWALTRAFDAATVPP